MTTSPPTTQASIHDLAWEGQKILFWSLVHLGGIAAFWSVPLPSWRGIAILLISGVLIMCLGVSVGVHRGVIHRTYQTHPWFERILVYLATLSGIAGPISLVRMHLYRDLFQQQPDCPVFFGYNASPLRSYIIAMWMRYAGPKLDESSLQPLESSAFFRFLEKTFLLQQIPLAALFYLIAGWEGVVWGIFIRLIVTYNLVWLTNYVCHRWGEKPYAFPDRAEEGRNNALFALLSFGEGWHNNHHAFPHSARFGLGYQLDMAYLVIVFFERIGLIWEVCVVHEDELRVWQPSPPEEAHFAPSSSTPTPASSLQPS